MIRLISLVCCHIGHSSHAHQCAGREVNGLLRCEWLSPLSFSGRAWTYIILLVYFLHSPWWYGNQVYYVVSFNVNLGMDPKCVILPTMIRSAVYCGVTFSAMITFHCQTSHDGTPVYYVDSFTDFESTGKHFTVLYFHHRSPRYRASQFVAVDSNRWASELAFDIPQTLVHRWNGSHYLRRTFSLHLPTSRARRVCVRVRVRVHVRVCMGVCDVRTFVLMCGCMRAWMRACLHAFACIHLYLKYISVVCVKR